MSLRSVVVAFAKLSIRSGADVDDALEAVNDARDELAALDEDDLDEIRDAELAEIVPDDWSVD